MNELIGPSREVDRLLYDIALDGRLAEIDGRLAEIWPHWTHEERADIVPRYTESLDAIVALIEQKLPGWCNSSIRDETGCEAYIWSRAGGKHVEIRGVHQHRAIAMCIAFLKALESGQ